MLELNIRKMVDALREEQGFLADGWTEADAPLQKKFNSPNASQALLKALCWGRVQYNTLLRGCRDKLCIKYKVEQLI